MRIRKPGKINDHLWLLGREESCIYLLKGQRESMIISGGMSYLVPDILDQFEAWGIELTQIRKLLILHAHFDHVGVVPFLKNRHPGLEIFASTRAWEILGMPKAITTINEFSRDVAKRMGMADVYASYDLDWQGDIEGKEVSEGDRFDLGDLDVHIYETPGHSSCSISAYVPQLKAIFASDGGGVPYKETIFTPGNSNFTKFQQSLEKIKDLDVAYVCADHFGYVAGKEAKDFFKRAIELAKQERALLEAVYMRTKDIDLAAREAVGAFAEEHPDYLLTPEISLAVYRQVFRHIASNAPSQNETT
jgi:glyoxylase-like metal-dependent hydrolase (beta-lactamase superfamily II)